METLYVDVSAAVHRRAGLGRYAASLANALVPLAGGRLALFYNREKGISTLAGLERLPARTVGLGYKPWRMLAWLGQLGRVGFDRLLPDAGVFHATEHLLPPLKGIPTVLTVHDLVYLHYPEHHKPLNRWFLRGAMPLFCRRAGRIVAVSGHTAMDLVRSYGVPEAKITVIHEAAAHSFRPVAPETVSAACAKYGLPERYVLFVGTIEPRKNLVRLLAAYERVLDQGLADGLVIVGRRGWLTGAFFDALQQSPARKSVILPGFVADADLPAIYAGAKVFAFPSDFEGFGLPVLEAMACGTPVVCSNSSSLPEVAGDAAVLTEPGDAPALADALGRVLSNPDLSREMSVRGSERATSFSWEKAARQTLAVYERAAADRTRSS